MAIRSIIADIKSTMKNDLKTRNDQYKTSRIRFIFDKKHGVDTITTLILDGYINTPAVKKHIASTGGTVSFTKSELDTLRGHVERNWKKVFTVNNIASEHRSLGYNVTKTIKQAKAIANSTMGMKTKLFPVAIYKTGVDVTAVYLASFYGKKHSFGGGDAQNVVVRNLMNECIDNSIMDMTSGALPGSGKPFGLGGRKPVVSRGTIKTNMPREGSYRRRVHGEPIGGRTGGSDTTVPSVNMIEVLQKHSKTVATRAAMKSKLSTSGVVDKLVEEAIDGITAGLKIKRNTMSSAIKHNSKVEIVMTLANDVVNTYQHTRADRHPLEVAANSVERAMLHKFKSPDYQASKSPKKRLVEVGSKQIVQNMFPHKSNPDMRYKVNKRLVAQGKTESINDVVQSMVALTTAAYTRKATKSAKGKRPPRARGTAQGKVAQAAGENPMALRNLLNELLPQVVAKNMTSPALNYRTGRFANSVNVDNVTQGARGGNTMIEASYMTDPYSTFAPGGKKYTPQRNPEALIKKSVREIATGIVGARFGVTVD